MSVEQITYYPPLDPQVQQQFDARHDMAVATLEGMHRLAGTTPLPKGEWSTPSYQSFSNNDVLGKAPLQRGSAVDNHVMRGYRIDANGQSEPVTRLGTTSVGDTEFTRVIKMEHLAADANYAGSFVRTADLDTVQAAKRAESAERHAKQARQAKPIGVTVLTEMTRAGQKSATELIDKYYPDFHKAGKRPVLSMDESVAAKPKYNQPKKYPEPRKNS